jgi:leader peptidase (prepilin peptidase)/N-methyltransferase
MFEAFFQAPGDWLSAIFGIFGLLIGSFLNVVIHRYPRMIDRERKTPLQSTSMNHYLIRTHITW